MAAKNRRKPKPKEKKPPAINGSKAMTRQALIYFVIGACMFTLGIFVGRGTAPVRFDIQELQKELTQLREAMVKKEAQQASVYRQVIDSKAQLDFYEELKKTGSSGKIAVFSDTRPEKPAKSKPQQKTIQNRDTPSKQAVSRTAGKSPSPGNLTIQVASVKDVKAADAMVSRLKQKGYAAHRVISKIPGKGIWFRIRVGAYKRKADAESIMKRLERDRFSPMIVNANY